MKIIDVLNKIANGEEVRFKIGGEEYHCFKYSNLWGEEEVRWYISEDWLNTEVEIIEEKKIPEKLNYQVGFGGTEQEVISEYVDDVVTKVNEIIDYLKSKGEKND